MDRGIVIVGVIALVAILGLAAFSQPSTTGAVIKEGICGKNYYLCVDNAEKEIQMRMCAEIFIICMQFGP